MNNIEDSFIILYVVVLIISIFRRIFGFGDALIGMPIIAHYFGFQIASPIIALNSLILALYLLKIDFQLIKFKKLILFICFGFIGVYFGISLISLLNKNLLLIVLSIILILVSLNNLFLKIKIKENYFIDIIFGLLAGLMGGAFNSNGPASIISISSKFQGIKEFRANLQAVLIPINLFIITNQINSNFWNINKLEIFLKQFIFVMLGIYVGNLIIKKTDFEKNKNILWILILAIGIYYLFINIF